MRLPKPAMIKIAQAHEIQPWEQRGTGTKPTVRPMSQIGEK